MLYFLLMISTLMATGKSVIFKKIGTDTSSTKQLLLFNSFSFVLATIIAFISTGFAFEKLICISKFSLVMSVLFASSIIITYLTQIKSMAMGQASSTILIYSCGFLIPIFFGVFCYGEEISVVQIISIFVLLLSLFLIINPRRQAGFSVKWLIFSILSMIGSGTTAILQKIHQRSSFADEFSLMLFWTFLFASIVLFVIALIIRHVEQPKKITKNDIGSASLSGIFIGILNILNLRLAGKLPAVILFPTYNVGSIILSGIICAFLFKERNTKKQNIGFAIGCIAILFIGLF